MYEDVLINVTSFFRDPVAFDVLKRKIFPKIVDKAPEVPIRVWVAGCATGEEAYSIAMCLLEFLDRQPIKPPIQIYATDISDWAIERARTGFYKQSGIADISPERLQRFFVAVEGGYQISKPVRELCVFAKQNLCSDPPFSKLDLISCRNVLIYLGKVLQAKVLSTFHYGLNPVGFLMLGTSETTGESSDLFSLVDKKHKIYSRKLVPVRLPLDLAMNHYPSEISNPSSRIGSAGWSDTDLQKEADQIVLRRYAPVGVIINNDLDILHFRGQTSLYLEPAPGRASHNLIKMAKEGLKLELRTAIHQAQKENLPVRKEGLRHSEHNQVRQINLEVIPIKAFGQVEERYFLVLFEESALAVAPQSSASSAEQTQQEKQAAENQEIARLHQEVETTKECLRAIIEEQETTNQEMRVANEEILSSNEEFQSSNEELETAKEEIQATNEELNTINYELQRRNLELMEVSNDLQNLISSTNIPILMLGSDLRIRRFTPLAQSILHLIAGDIGRPFGDIHSTLNVSNLESQVLEVMNTLTVKEQEVQDHRGHWYRLRIRPYRTIDNKIDGAMLMLLDIDALKRGIQALEYSWNYAQAIVETVREPLIVLDSSLRVLTANQSFYRTFEVIAAETEQRVIFELGNGQWNIPKLRLLLLEILPDHKQFEDFEVEHDFEQIGHKVMLLNGRTMTQSEGSESILLSIEDITERKQLEAKLTYTVTQEQSARSAAEAANLAKDHFLSIVSHELRNPLTAILGWSQLLLTKSCDEARTTHAVEIIEQSARAQNKLIGDLLDISSITSGKLRLKTRQIQLTSVIEATLKTVRALAEAKHIQLESSLEPEAKPIMGDPDRLQQVLLNLLTNAIKFTPSGGRVNIALTHIETEAQVIQLVAGLVQI